MIRANRFARIALRIARATKDAQISLTNLKRILKLYISRRASEPKRQKTLICRKSGVSADSRKSVEKCDFPHFLELFWNRRKPHFLCTLMCFCCFGSEARQEIHNSKAYDRTLHNIFSESLFSSSALSCNYGTLSKAQLQVSWAKPGFWLFSA